MGSGDDERSASKLVTAPRSTARKGQQISTEAVPALDVDEAASRLGISVGPDTQRITMQTANGPIDLPLVRLGSVELAGARVEGLMATLNPTMSIGLLGGAFFNQFTYGVDPAANVITLERNYAAVVPSPSEDHWRRRFRKVRGSLEQLDTYLRDREGLDEPRREELERKRGALE